MEIGRMNPMGTTVADKSYDFTIKRVAPDSSGGVSAEKSNSGTAPLDVARLETAMSAENDSDANTEEFLQKLIQQVNNRLAGGHRMFNYSRHEKTGQLMIKILDSETKEVVREIPPEKTLDAVARMWDMMGIFVDNKT